MKSFFTIGGASLLATSAMAHDGTHLHPHGAESVLMAILVAALGVAAVTFVKK